MNLLARHLLVTLASGLVTLGASAQSNTVITSFHQNGEVQWTGEGMRSYSIEWASDLNGPWTNSWAHLAEIAATNGVQKAKVPMFYRVVGYTDPPAVLLIHGDGPAGSSAITDEKGHTLTSFGGVQISTNESRFGGASLFFDGSGDYISSPIDQDWSFGTGDFTIDLWFRLTADVDPVQFIGCHVANFHADWLVSRYSGTLGMNLSSGQLRTPVTPSLNTWHHLAATRDSGVLRIFVNGELRAQQMEAGDWGCTHPLTIGRADNDWGYMAGYMDEIRIVKGQAVWTGNFTPPTAPYSR